MPETADELCNPTFVSRYGGEAALCRRNAYEVQDRAMYGAVAGEVSLVLAPPGTASETDDG